MASTTTRIFPSSSSPSFSTTPWKCDAFISFHSADNRYHFVEALRYSLEERTISVFRGDEEMEREHSFKAIEESQYAVVVVSEDYVMSKRCLRELTKIMERKKDRSLKVLPVFRDVDPFDVRNLREGVEKAFNCHIHGRVDKEELESWRAALEELGDCLVDHPDVGKQKGCFTGAFARNKDDPNVEKEPCEECRADLIEAGQLIGWYLQSRSKLTVVKEISVTIFGGLMRTLPDVPKCLVGMDSAVKRMWRLLDIELVKDIWRLSTDVCFVGIHGVSGIGKTTLAKVIYGRLSSQFTVKCFVARIGDASDKDLLRLQKYLMSEILAATKANMLNDWDKIHEGARLLGDRLRMEKVLIVLDDVRRETQVDALAGKRAWFGKGSRIIITSRNYSPLYPCGGKIYEVKELNEDDALKLFCLKSFNTRHPAEKSVGLIRDILPHLRHIPLTLEVFGSCLIGAEKSVWESYRLQLKAATNIWEELQIALDGLEDLVQEAFLDFASCCNGWSIDVVISKLQSLGYPSESILKDLECRSLVKFSADRKIFIHDILIEMGVKIAEQNRLLCIANIMPILEKNRTSDVKGIFLDLTSSDVKLTEAMKCFKALSRIENLRVLHITFDDNDLYCISMVEMIEREMKEGSSKLQLSENKLCVMEWWGYPFECLPTFGFEPTNLVALILRYSCIERLWYGQKWLSGLKHIDLSFSAKLIEMPDLRQFSNLEILNLSFCKHLSTVHSSIGYHERLKQLLLKGCCSLENLPGKINLKSLEVLDLSSCSNLNKFPDIAKNMSSLKHLDISESAIKELPSSFERLWLLEEFHAKGSVMRELSFPIVLSKELRYLDLSFNKFTKIPNSVYQVHNLVKLSLSHCSQLKELPKGFFSGLRSLLELDLSGCNLGEIPTDLDHCSSLLDLNLSRNKITKLSKSLGKLSALVKLSLSCCSELKELPMDFFLGLRSLSELDLSGCNLGEIPIDLGHCSSLSDLNLSWNKFTKLPKSLGKLSALVKLSLSYCSELKELPMGFFLGLTSLSQLNLSYCNLLDEVILEDLSCYSSLLDLDLSGNKFTKLPKRLCELCNLVKLSISHCNELKELSKDLFLGLRSLSELDLSYCNLPDGTIPEDLGCCFSLSTLNLSGNKFTKLPKTLSALSILKTLFLNDCTSLESLPNLPLRLFYLELRNCPALIPFDQQPNIGIPNEMLRQCDHSSAVACIGFRDKPYKILYLHSQSPPWEKHAAYHITPMVACGTKRLAQIPKWFPARGTCSGEIKIRMDWDWDFHSVGPKACALLIVCKVDVPILPEFVCQFGFDEASPKDSAVFCLPKISGVDPSGMWVYVSFPYAWQRSKSWDKPSYWASIATSSVNLEFEWGASLLRFSDDPELLDDSESRDELSFYRTGMRTRGPNVASTFFDLSDSPLDSNFDEVMSWICGRPWKSRSLHDSIHGFVTVRGPIKMNRTS